jgi:hypothetical protein
MTGEKWIGKDAEGISSDTVYGLTLQLCTTFNSLLSACAGGCLNI